MRSTTRVRTFAAVGWTLFGERNERFAINGIVQLENEGTVPASYVQLSDSQIQQALQIQRPSISHLRIRHVQAGRQNL